MNVPIIGETNHPHMIVRMIPGLAPGTFDIHVDTQNFLGGAPLAAQCLLQAAMFMLPQAFQAIASQATQQLLDQQRAQRNGEF